MDKAFVSKFLKGSASTTLGTLSSVVFHFLSISLITRFTTREVLGLYFLIIAIANGGKILASLGLDLTLVHYFVSGEKSVQQELFAAVIWTRVLVLGVITLLVFLLGSYLLEVFDDGLVVYRWYLPVMVALMSFRELYFYILQGLQKFRLYALIQTASAILKCILIVILRESLDLNTLLQIELVMLGLSLLAQIWVMRSAQLRPPHLRLNRAILPEILRFGLPLYANSLFTYISNFGAVFIVGVFLNPLSIAAYEVARKIPEGVTRLLNSFTTVYFPGLSSLFAKGDLKNAQKLMNTSLILLASSTFALVLGVLLFSHEIVVLVFSAKYLGVQSAFVLLMLAVSMHLLANTMGYSLVSAGRPERSTITNIVSMGLELGLSLLFIPQVGYIGAAYSYIIMTIIAQGMSFIYLRQVEVHLNLGVYLRPYLLLGVLAAIYLAVGSEAFLWRTLLLAMYCGLCLIFIPDCRRAMLYLWDFIQHNLWHKRGTSHLQDQASG